MGKISRITKLIYERFFGIIILEKKIVIVMLKIK